MPDEKEYATAPSSGFLKKSKPVLLLKGESETIEGNWNKMEGGKRMDMQKVEMILKWNETFAETSLDKMKQETLEFSQ